MPTDITNAKGLPIAAPMTLVMAKERAVVLAATLAVPSTKTLEANDDMLAPRNALTTNAKGLEIALLTALTDPSTISLEVSVVKVAPPIAERMCIRARLRIIPNRLEIFEAGIIWIVSEVGTAGVFISS